LYFIILHEFHHSKFIEIENYESKLSAWANIRYDQRTDRSQSMEFIISNMNNSIVIPNIRDINLKDLAKQSTPGPRPGQNIEIVHKFYQRFLAVFTPEETSSFTYLDLSDENFIKQFKYNNSNKILLNFCEFLLKEKAMILKLDDTHYKLWDLFEMAETLL
jgi:hypothetical protein